MRVTGPLVELVGRDVERALLDASVRDGGRRLVTIRGVAGVGKTCLVRHHAASQPRAVLCDVTRAADTRDLCAAVARELGVGASIGVSRLGEVLARRGTISLVLDGAERIVDRLTRTLGAWLDAAPALRILVTSQVRLELPGERVIVLEPLAPHDAATLFRARAHDARGRALPDDPDTERAIAAIVRALDGIPSDLERIAARTVALTPVELATRLDELADVRALDRAWSLASPEAHRALEACALFEGELTLAAADAIRSGWSSSAITLQELCDRSLVRARDHADGTSYALYASVRRGARARLASRRGAARVRARFEEGVLALASSADADLDAPGAVAALARHRGDLERIAREACDAETRARAVLPLASLAALQGGIEDTWALLDAALAGSLEDTLHARLRHARARLARRMGRPRDALADFEAASALAGTSDLAPRIATDWAGLMRHLGRRDEARALYQRALDAYAARGDARGRGRTLSSLATMTHEHGDLEGARVLYEEAVAALVATNDRLALAMARQNLGLLEQESGDLDAAEQTFRRALDAHRALGNRRFEAISELDLACLELERGRPRDALDGLARAQAIARASGDRREVGLAAATSGACHAMAGALAAAERAFAIARRELRDVDEPALRLALEVHELHGDLAEADRARIARDARRSAELLASIDARIDEAERARATGDEVRFALRVLRAERARWVARARSATVARDGTWFTPPGHAPVSLAPRPVLASILRALVAQHLRRADVPLANEAVVRAGWPAERTLTRASRNRLHVAIATLRKLGLDAHLVSQGEGYLLERVAVHDPALE
ncbi:Transcriptional regulator, LuxR family protein [Sandaracinus amylolyticus]|uniref:Transcriptional regulator, LuxR family protein n=2 Tax=Sandaracinus amylolyticus TaxID=927083 RepID=A0A0F6YL46_9BACT|nr:Transcriptional regulator, LuxR family protein [Sandaracinus amylolyticus]